MFSNDKLLDQIPPDYRERFVEIAALTDTFCDRFLNDEYKDICRFMAASFCEEESPVLKGKAASWACGIAYAVGWVNFLTDPSQTPHMKAEEIASGFGVSTATMHAKHREIRNRLDLMPMHPAYTIDSRIDDNPFIWYLELDGFVMDIRLAPREVQVMAFENGLIPYIPADREDEET